LETIKDFEEMFSNNLIENTDLSSYKGFEDLFEQLNIAHTKRAIKSDRKQVQVIMDTDEWLCVRPLTHEASLKYGASTKWCTASEKNPDAFYEYSRSGSLIYLFNKVNLKKFGIEVSVRMEKKVNIYNEIDERIDSSVARIPMEVMDYIFKGIGFYDDYSSFETNRQYIERNHPDIHEKYWLKGLENLKSHENTYAEPVMAEVDVMRNRQIDEWEVNEPETETPYEDFYISQNSDTDEYIDYIIGSIQEQLKPKTIFHKWFRNIFYGGHEKLVLIGVPTRKHGMDALKRASEFFGEIKGYKVVFYPINEGKDLEITKL
jgi:hypothetical protein